VLVLGLCGIGGVSRVFCVVCVEGIGGYCLGLYLERSGVLAMEVNVGCMRTSLGMHFV